MNRRAEAERLSDSSLVAAVASLRGQRSVGTAESCTAGAIGLALAKGDGASEWFRGSIVSYHRDVKYDLLKVPVGPVVNHLTARTMAAGAARVLGADVVVSVTGAAGPEGLDGAAPGTVFIGYWCQGEVDSVEMHFDGAPGAVCAAATTSALAGLVERLTAPSDQSC